MPINQNHLFEDLNGVKCAIVEKNVNPDRVSFLRDLLELNGFTVVTAPSAPPKSPTPAVPATGSDPVPAINPAKQTFTVGVTDTTFNPINAIFGRLLRTRDGHIVTLAYWQQKEDISNDEIPYFHTKP